LRITEAKEELKRVDGGVEYSTIGCKVAITFIIIFGMCKRKSEQ
jgi:hypothetical protein